MLVLYYAVKRGAIKLNKHSVLDHIIKKYRKNTGKKSLRLFIAFR